MKKWPWLTCLIDKVATQTTLSGSPRLRWFSLGGKCCKQPSPHPTPIHGLLNKPVGFSSGQSEISKSEAFQINWKWVVLLSAFPVTLPTALRIQKCHYRFCSRNTGPLNVVWPRSPRTASTLKAHSELGGMWPGERCYFVWSRTACSTFA